jgi:hypothetical protein
VKIILQIDTFCTKKNKNKMKKCISIWVLERYRVTGLQGYRVTGLQGYKVTGLQGYIFIFLVLYNRLQAEAVTMLAEAVECNQSHKDAFKGREDAYRRMCAGYVKMYAWLGCNNAAEVSRKIAETMRCSQRQRVW